MEFYCHITLCRENLRVKLSTATQTAPTTGDFTYGIRFYGGNVRTNGLFLFETFGPEIISKVSSAASVASKVQKVEAVVAVASKAETVAAGTSGLKGAINSVSNRIVQALDNESGVIGVGTNVGKGASSASN